MYPVATHWAWTDEGWLSNGFAVSNGTIKVSYEVSTAGPHISRFHLVRRSAYTIYFWDYVPIICGIISLLADYGRKNVRAKIEGNAASAAVTRRLPSRALRSLLFLQLIIL